MPDPFEAADDPAYTAAAGRYDVQAYRPCGRSGLRLPAVSLGLWHHFGGQDAPDRARAIARCAFDHGITHFDLANNYGPPPGSAETLFGHLLRRDFAPYRDELVISTKAGYVMGPGPYGDGGSRKYLLNSLDQSLRRLGLDHVDLFYHHRPDPATPLEETLGALDQAVRSGRALYVGVSNYPPDLLRQAAAGLRALGTPCLIHQPRYSMISRAPEQGLLQACADEGVGCIAFSPLGQGLLSGRYLDGSVAPDSRAARGVFLRPQDITPARLHCLRRLDAIAQARGQNLAQLAVTWVLRQRAISSVLIGASRPQHIQEAVAASRAAPLGDEELAAIERALEGWH